MSRLRIGGVLGGLFLSCLAGAQTGIFGTNRYPQFRSQGVMPGTAASLLRDGTLSAFGAFSHSTPIAYSLAPFRGTLVFSSLSSDLSLAAIRDEGSDAVDGNATAGAQVGIPLGSIGSFTASWMILSGEFDNVGNAHFAPRMPGPVQFAIGVQDYWGNGGRSGEGQPEDFLSSTSWYGVATYEFEKGVYGSLGLGSGRFQPAFGSLSAAINDRVGVYVEHDSFNVNFGIRLANPFGTRVPSGWGRDAQTGFTFADIGIVASKYTYWQISVAF